MTVRVNQKLYFSRLLLERARTQVGQPQLADLEGAVLHLAVAYRSHVADIARQYGELLHPDENAAELVIRLAAADQHAAELDQLAGLERDDGWAHHLLKLAQRIIAPLPDASAPPVRSSSLGIPAVQIDDQDLFADQQSALNVIAGWQAAFAELVSSQRQQSQEW